MWSYQNARFFSTNISAQRLPNGNTLITAGAGGRMFEVTVKGEIVWEYIIRCLPAPTSNAVYRSSRIPYGRIPQLTRRQKNASRRQPWVSSRFRSEGAGYAGHA